MHAKRSDDPITPTQSRKARRFRAALIAVACWAVLAAAWSLTPRASGHGTHQQLGLPGCGVLVRTGYPCPSCGLTTSIAAMTRGRVAAAFRAQPFGVIAAPLILALGLAGTVETIAGMPIIGILRPRLWWIWGGVLAMLLGWGVKLIIGWAGGEFPIR